MRRSVLGAMLWLTATFAPAQAADIAALERVVDPPRTPLTQAAVADLPADAYQRTGSIPPAAAAAGGACSLRPPRTIACCWSTTPTARG